MPNAIDGEFLLCLAAQFLHLAHRHGFVCLIFQIERGAAMRMISYDTFENHHGSVLRSAKLRGEFGGGNRIACDAKEITACAAAHRRHKRHLIAIAQGGGALGDLLIDREQK